MFARRVSMHLQPNRADELTRKLERDIIPRLRNLNGFQDELVFISPSKKDAVAISLWDRAESAEAYNRSTYPDVLKSLATLVEGTPQVETYEVCNSTFHKIAVAV
jgi:hypothetical protein